MIDDLEYKQFKVMQEIAKQKIRIKKVYWNNEELFRKINKPGLEDENALLRIFEKQLKEYNAKLDADEKKINRLQPKKAYNTKYFKGINLEQPEMKISAIAKQFV